MGLLIPLLAVAFSVALADTVTYEYDALGRLTEVRHSDGSTVTYTLDPAGNRAQVATSTPPGTPASISVPAI
ncbi:MAG: RHS repeat domain-containing protein, partial [Steroidobacteraceae bacterium]